MSGAAVLDRPTVPEAAGDMVFVPGGTFRMGSDRHYPEEAPVHQVGVDGFWIDRTPVTDAEFQAFVRATGHVTVAERKSVFAASSGEDSHEPRWGERPR